MHVSSADTADAVREIDVPPEARALTTLSPIAYEDAFLVQIGGAPERTASQWARTVIASAPVAVRTSLVMGWSAIGLRLGPTRDEKFVLGWTVRRSDPDVAVLAADAATGLAGELLFRRHQDELLFATFIRHETFAARAAWATVEPMHRPVVRRLLERASREAGTD